MAFVCFLWNQSFQHCACLPKHQVELQVPRCCEANSSQLYTAKYQIYTVLSVNLRSSIYPWCCHVNSYFIISSSRWSLVSCQLPLSQVQNGWRNKINQLLKVTDSFQDPVTYILKTILLNLPYTKLYILKVLLFFPKYLTIMKYLGVALFSSQFSTGHIFYIFIVINFWILHSVYCNGRCINAITASMPWLY